MTGLILGVEARAYNATIRSERLKRGLTQREVDELAGVTQGTTGRLETLRDPRVGERELRVLSVLGLDASASPEWLQGLDLYGTKRVERSVTAELFAQPERLMLESPLSISDPSWDAEDSEDNENLRSLLRYLNKREKAVIELRFGLTGEDCLKMSDVAHRVYASEETCRDIEQRAFEKMRTYAPDVFGRDIIVATVQA